MKQGRLEACDSVSRKRTLGKLRLQRCKREIVQSIWLSCECSLAEFDILET